MRTEALVAAKHAGGAIKAMRHLQDKCDSSHDDLHQALRELIIEDVGDLCEVKPGIKLRNQKTQHRYIMTTTKCTLVDLDTGSIHARHDVPFPLEIYHYAK